MPRDGRRIKGSADERARARDRLRGELLDAARALAEEKGGFDGVTIRAVAERVGYQAPVVYEYFAGKRALLLAAVDAGFADLACRLSRTDGTLTGTSGAYWEFALAQPHLYRLMHGLVDVPFGTPETPASARGCFALMKEAVTRARPDHQARGLDGDAATDLFWAQLHGLVVLTLDGRIRGGPDRARTLLPHL